MDIRVDIYIMNKRNIPHTAKIIPRNITARSFTGSKAERKALLNAVLSSRKLL